MTAVGLSRMTAFRFKIGRADECRPPDYLEQILSSALIDARKLAGRGASITPNASAGLIDYAVPHDDAGEGAIWALSEAA